MRGAPLHYIRFINFILSAPSLQSLHECVGNPLHVLAAMPHELGVGGRWAEVLCKGVLAYVCDKVTLVQLVLQSRTGDRCLRASSET